MMATLAAVDLWCSRGSSVCRELCFGCVWCAE